MLLVGTSGWSYKDWNGKFYPTTLPAREQLSFLSRQFDTVELNASFYHPPSASNFKRWHDTTPPDFRFTVKAPRGITHLKRLADVADDWHHFTDCAALLDGKLGVYLLQFPPSFAATAGNLSRLEAFLEITDASIPRARLAFELRHQTWFQDMTLKLLQNRQLCLVQAESEHYPHSPAGFSPASFAYYRFHGPRQLYASQYTTKELDYWAGLIQTELDAGKDAYVYFDNTAGGYALEDARALRKLLGAP